MSRKKVNFSYSVHILALSLSLFLFLSVSLSHFNSTNVSDIVPTDVNIREMRERRGRERERRQAIVFQREPPQVRETMKRERVLEIIIIKSQLLQFMTTL